MFTDKYHVFLLLILQALLTVVAYYLAEAPYSLFSSKSKLFEFLILVFVMDVSLLLYLVFKRNWLTMGALLASMGLPFFSSYWAIGVVNQAFENCRKNAEEIRLKILEYKNINAQYPESLQEINFSDCGKLYMHDSLLKYKKQSNDFEIYFRDELILYSGNSENPIDAKK